MVNELFEKRVVLVTGKGGVGRTTVTAALALAAARAGKRVLVTEIREPTEQGWSHLARYFGRETLPHTAEELAPGVRGSLLVTEKGTELFLGSVLRVRAMARLAMRVGPLVSFLHATPSFHELGVFYHLLTYIQEKDRSGRPLNELILMDMPATGHTIALTGLPDILLRIIPSGPIATALRDGQSVLNDPRTAAACVVTLPELLPITEAIELVEGLRETRVPVGGIIVNRVPRTEFSESEWDALRAMLDDGGIFGRTALDRVERAGEAIQRLKESTEVGIREWDEILEGEGRAVVNALADRLSEGEAS